MFGFLNKPDADNYYQPAGNYVSPSMFKDKLSRLLDYQPLIAPDYLDIVQLRKALNIDSELVPPPTIKALVEESKPTIPLSTPSIQSSINCNNWKNLMRSSPVDVVTECGDSLVQKGYLELSSNVRQEPIRWQDIANHLMTLSDILTEPVFNQCIQLLRQKDPNLFLFSLRVLQKTKRFWRFFVQPNGVPRFTEDDGSDVVDMMEAGRYYDAGQQIFVYPIETISVSFIIETINRTILSGSITFAQYRLLKEKYPSIQPMYEGINCYTAYSSPINVCQSPFEILDQCGLQKNTQSSLMRCATDLYSHTNSDSYNKARNLLKTKYNIDLPSLPIDDCSLYSLGYTGKLFTNPYDIYTQCTPLGVEPSILINKLIEQIAMDPSKINKVEYDRLRVLVSELPPLSTIVCINYVNGKYDSQIYSAPYDVYQQCLPLGVSKRLYINQVKSLLQQDYKQFNLDQYNRLREAVPEEDLPLIPSVSCNGSQDEKCEDPSGYINDCIGNMFYTTKSYIDASNEIKQCPITNFNNTNVDSYNRARDLLFQKGITIPPWPSVNCSTISTVDVCTNPEGYLHSCPGVGLTTLDDIVVELRKCGKGNMVDRTNRDGYEKVRLELVQKDISIPPLPSVICENDAPSTFCANPIPYISACPGITYLSLQDYANKLVSQCNNRKPGQTPFTNNYIGDYQAYKQAQDYLVSKGINVIDYQWPVQPIVADCKNPCAQPYLYVSGDIYNPNPIINTGVLCKPSMTDRATDIGQCISLLGPENTTDTQFLLPGINMNEYNKARDYLSSKGITIPSYVEDCYRSNPQYLIDHANELLQICPDSLQSRIIDSVRLAAKNQIQGIVTNVFRSPTISESAYTAFRSTHSSLQLPEWNQMLAEATICTQSITPELACDVSKASSLIQYCSTDQKQLLAKTLPTCALNYMDTFRTNDPSVQASPKLTSEDYTILANQLRSQNIQVSDWSSITSPTPEKVCANPLFYATQTKDPGQLQQIAAMLLACATTRLLGTTNLLKYMEARTELSKKGISIPEVKPAPTSCDPNDIKKGLCVQGAAIPIINSCTNISPQNFGDLLNQTCNQLNKDSTAVNETTNKYLSFTDQLAGRVNPSYFSKDEEVYTTVSDYLQTLGATVIPFKNPTDICNQPCLYPTQYVTSCNIDPVKAGQDLEKCRTQTTPHFQTGKPISVLPPDDYNQARSYLSSNGVSIGPYPDPDCYNLSPSSLCSVAVYDRKKELGCPPVISSDQIRDAAIQCAKNYQTQTTPYIIKDEYNQLQSREPSLPDWDTINPPVTKCNWIYSTSGDSCKSNDTTSSSGRGDLYRTVIVTKTGTQCEYTQGQQVLQAPNGCDIPCVYESNWTDPGLNSCTLSSDGSWYRPLKKTRLSGGGDSCPLELTRQEWCKPEPCKYEVDTTKQKCYANRNSSITGKGNLGHPYVLSSPGRFGGETSCPINQVKYQPVSENSDNCNIECKYGDWIPDETCSQPKVSDGDTSKYRVFRRNLTTAPNDQCPAQQTRDEPCRDCVYLEDKVCIANSDSPSTQKGDLTIKRTIIKSANDCPLHLEDAAGQTCDIECTYEKDWTQTEFCTLDEASIPKKIELKTTPSISVVENGLGSKNNPASSPDQLQLSGITQDGYYWYKTPGMIDIRQLYTRFNYDDGKPWVLVFSSPKEEPATVNEVGYNIPFKGFMLHQVENGWKQYTYFDTEQLFNERTTSEIATKGNRPGYKVFIGKPGGHGFYTSQQEVCNWASALDGLGAGWWDDGKGCGSFPNQMRWGQGFTQDYASYTDVGKTWETLIWWDGGVLQSDVSPPSTKSEGFRYRREDILPASIENASYYNVYTRKLVSGDKTCPPHLVKKELCSRTDCQYTETISCKPNPTSTTQGDTVVKINVIKPALNGGTSCPVDRVISNSCEILCEYESNWNDPGFSGCGNPTPAGIYTRTLTKKKTKGDSNCIPELTQIVTCDPEPCEYEFGPPVCDTYQDTPFNGKGLVNKRIHITKPSIFGGACSVKEGDIEPTGEFCDIPCTYGSWSDLGSCEFDPSENRWYRSRTAPRLSGGGPSCPNPGIQRERCEPQTCTYTTNDECVSNDSTVWSGRGDFVKTVTSVSSVPYASCDVYVGKKIVTPDGCNYGAMGTGECKYTTEKVCYENADTKTTFKGDLNETVTSLENLTSTCPVTMVGQSFYTPNGCNYLENNCVFDYTELGCNPNSNTSWSKLGDSLRRVTSVTNPNNKPCAVSYVGQEYTEPDGCYIAPSSSSTTTTTPTTYNYSVGTYNPETTVYSYDDPYSYDNSYSYSDPYMFNPNTFYGGGFGGGGW
jgi:hypothetical protein